MWVTITPAGEVNFNFGSRYGRGENIEPKATNDKSNELMARVDRFYLGSRYGKRERNNNNLFGSSNGENFIDLNNIQDVLRYFYRLQRRTKQLPKDNVDYIDGENFKSKNDQYIFHKDNFIKWKPSVPKSKYQCKKDRLMAKRFTTYQRNEKETLPIIQLL
ncbi:hypothetical protein KQX54_015847 [Cotesia glomerata]|uniref:Uncharacterized protein n=1 Tax=Cotesia glomerata TaxID=32391 RepID=A0AAV7I844_COTGL|nr:hypothetical protein KQX54_015847 [Cotesia glomerata]